MRMVSPKMCTLTVIPSLGCRTRQLLCSLPRNQQIHLIRTHRHHFNTHRRYQSTDNFSSAIPRKASVANVCSETPIKIRGQPGEDVAYGQRQHIQDLISSLPLVRYLRSLASTIEANSYDDLREFRLHSNKNPDTCSRHLVAGSLFGKDKLPIHPRLFMQKFPTPRIVAVFYVGSHLCGHPGYVHGGLPFVLFDDIFALCAGMGFESGVAMTANMNLNFRKPCLPDRICIIHAEVVKHEGRKAWVEGSIRSLDPFTVQDMQSLELPTSADRSIEVDNSTLTAEASAMFVEPKFAEVCNKMCY